jgi:hypothetical protein
MKPRLKTFSNGALVAMLLFFKLQLSDTKSLKKQGTSERHPFYNTNCVETASARLSNAAGFSRSLAVKN